MSREPVSTPGGRRGYALAGRIAEVGVARVHYGWIMLSAIVLMTFASSGSRFSFGVFVQPMSESLHWDRA